jgi:hypothetical protein
MGLDKMGSAWGHAVIHASPSMVLKIVPEFFFNIFM